MTKPEAVKPQEFARLRSDVYQDLERKCGAIVVTRETTDVQAGFQLGVQHVLRLLREGYVIGR